MPLIRPVAPTGSTDPNSNQGGSNRHGSTGDTNKSGEFGTVIVFDSNTFAATVRTERGRVLTGVPCLRSNPGEIAPLPTGTEVAISYEFGQPIIVGCISLPSTKNEEVPSFSVTDATGFGGQGENQSTFSEGNYRRPGEPTDLIPGDWAAVGPDGNGFARLGGGTSIMKSGPMSQIRTHRINDLVEIFSRTFRHVTDMGEIKVTNEGGKINWSFRGGVTQRTEAGPDEEKWSIRADLGATGDVLNFELTTPGGQTLFKFHVDASGHCEIFGINGVNIASGNRYNGSHSEEHNGDSSKNVGGNQIAAVAGTATHTYGNSLKETIGGNLETTAGNDIRMAAMRDIAVAAGRSLRVNAIGPLPPLPGQIAAALDVTTGELAVTVGTPASIPKTSNYKTTVYSSDITTEVSPLGVPGNITTSTLLGVMTDNSLQRILNTNSVPNSIMLGGPFIASNLVKFQELSFYIEALHTALAQHTHALIPGAATAGPFGVIGLTGPPIPGILEAPLGSVLPCMSLVAGVTA
jgi:hypothetical protein